jgi:hypothetical protein
MPLLAISSKFLSRALSRVNPYMDDIIGDQYGFRRNSSTIDQTLFTYLASCCLCRWNVNTSVEHNNLFVQ